MHSDDGNTTYSKLTRYVKLRMINTVHDIKIIMLLLMTQRDFCYFCHTISFTVPTYMIHCSDNYVNTETKNNNCIYVDTRVELRCSLRSAINALCLNG